VQRSRRAHPPIPWAAETNPSLITARDHHHHQETANTRSTPTQHCLPSIPPAPEPEMPPHEWPALSIARPNRTSSRACLSCPVDLACGTNGRGLQLRPAEQPRLLLQSPRSNTRPKLGCGCTACLACMRWLGM
jgi:hypothetical protein